jgi:hypothetical protein
MTMTVDHRRIGETSRRKCYVWPLSAAMAPSRPPIYDRETENASHGSRLGFSARQGRGGMPKPVLQAMVLADNVYVDAATGKHVIAGTFTGIVTQPKTIPTEESSEGDPGRVVRIVEPRQMGSPCLYLALFEVHGEVPIELRYVDLADSSVLFRAAVTLRADDPVDVAEYAIPVPKLPVHKAGDFSLDALYEEEVLGSWRISVKRLENPSHEGGLR